MGKLMEENIDGRRKDNVFYDSFKETVTFYQDCKPDIWEESATIALYDTGGEVGLFPHSDIIIVYDPESGEPSIVTERVYKKHYGRGDWRKLRRYLRQKTRIITQELGFNIRISYSRDYIDYVHYKEEWWQWALKQKKSQSH